VSGDQDPAALLHQLTKHGWIAGDRSRLVDFPRLDPANHPAPFKRYRGRPARPLPVDLGTSGVPAAAVLSGRAGPAPGEAPVDAAGLAALLFFSAGVTRASGAADHRTFFRAAMSAGNLHPIELYVVCGDLPGLPAGVYHFAPLEFALTVLRSGDWRPALAAAAADPEVGAAPVTLVVTGIPWRTAWKYGERGWRHLYWDAGTLLANLLATATGWGLAARVLLGFVDSEAARLVGVDEVDEFPLALAVVGVGGESAGEAPGPVDPLDVDVSPISARPLTLPLITEAQQAGSLRDPAAVASWRSAARDGAAPVAEPATGSVEEPGSARGLPIEEVVLRRGSTRVMHPEPVPEEVLSWGMAVASRPVPGDFAPEGATWLQHWLTLHAVDGVEPGTARWRTGGLEPGRRGDFRAASEHLCLDQPLGGDSAYTVFHCAELGPLMAVLGSRGYRVAQLEAGVAAGRLSLAAFTLGCGATGLTFFDDEVVRFFGTRGDCLLVTSVGVPAYRSAPGGRPQAPTELAGFDRLMGRVSLQLRRPRR
jgi:SagB-type dehydrogenase family enzyme